MKAVVCEDFGISSVQDVPRPNPARNEVLIKVDRVQLSVSECELYRGSEIGHYETICDRLERGDGRLFGHEFCGRIVNCGREVKSFEVGDRVYAPGKIPCFDCPHCERGYPHLCSNKQGIGFDTHGALAEYVALPTTPLEKLSSDVTDKEGAALQPLASALLCVIDAEIDPGDSVAVVGTGVMGYQCGQLASHLGAGEVFAVDIRSRPLKHAASRGLIPINAAEVDAAERIHKLTDGIGADVVLEAAGGNQKHGTNGDGPLAQAFKSARRGGTVVQVGHVSGDITITPRVLRSNYINWVNPRKGVITLGPNKTTGEFAVDLVADGSVSIDEFITHELSGLESFERAVEMTLDKDEHDTLGPVQIVVGSD